MWRGGGRLYILAVWDSLVHQDHFGGGRDCRIYTACLKEEWLGPRRFSWSTNENCLIWIRASKGREPEAKYTKGLGVSLGILRAFLREILKCVLRIFIWDLSITSDAIPLTQYYRGPKTLLRFN